MATNTTGCTSTAHKHHASATLDEGPPPASSLGQKEASSSNPKIPLDLIAGSILPFIADRATWNRVCCASKEICLAGKEMTPPWPNMTLNLRRGPVHHVAFSPSGSHLAFDINRFNIGQHHVVHVWDRWGKERLLVGHTTHISCLEYSSDEKYLAAGSEHGSIRLWHAESFHAASSKTSRERPTTTEQASSIILGRNDPVIMLSFSRTDSNLLASGGQHGRIKIWDIKDQACIHSFYHAGCVMKSLVFAGGADSACIAVADTGSIIRLWRAEGSSDFAGEIIVEAAGLRKSPHHAIFSPSGSFLATTSYSDIERGQTLALYDLKTIIKTQSVKTMTMTRSVIIPDVSAASCFAVSPDSKLLAISGRMCGIRLVQTNDFSIQRDLDTRRGSSDKAVLSAAFDPTCQVLAFGCRDGTVELRNL